MGSCKYGGKKSQGNEFMGLFKMFFYGTLGSVAALTATALFSLVFFIPGYFLIKKYNKPGSKPLQELRTQQYVGIILCAIGLLPWAKYLFAGFGLEAGAAVYDSLSE
tara:strand:+ start:136 stop:456 length:321 start_codon:yes stop_codon:yes gene_type:complete